MKKKREAFPTHKQDLHIGHIAREMKSLESLEYSILKAHVSLEYLLNNIIRFHWDVALPFFENSRNWGFSKKLEFIQAVCGFHQYPFIVSQLTSFNLLRNELAHSLKAEDLKNQILSLPHRRIYGVDSDYNMTDSKEYVIGWYLELAVALDNYVDEEMHKWTIEGGVLT